MVESEVRIVRVGCPAHNCGGRCLLLAHVQDGVITRLETDDRPDSVDNPQLRACVRGRAYLSRQYHPDRLRYPLKRVGARGEGKFERIHWDEALELLAGEILVAPFTDPGWTPYFVPAAAIVMDEGGIISHGSIIAREYGIPAVVNVGDATRIIKTGQTIQVDGNRGVVTILQ